MTITVKYGVSSVTREVESGTTYQQLVSDEHLKAVLGFGDNVKASLNGIEQPMANSIPESVLVVLETRANSKAN